MKYMEECLEMPLKKVLAIIQDRIMKETSYFGIKTWKSPLDFWVYQELITAVKPDVIVEIGNFQGGGTLALAHLCDRLGHGRIIALDVTHQYIAPAVGTHPRITLFEGDACESFRKVRSLIAANDRVLIIEDSSHTYENTLNVLRTYSSLLKPGDYFIVEDTICHHGVEVGPNPGPFEAIQTFLQENKTFQVDRSKESFLITWNPTGYLKKVA